MRNSIQCQEVSFQSAPAPRLQLGFEWFQLQALKLHGQPHVTCNLQLALEKRLRIREGGKRHLSSHELEEQFELHAADFNSYLEK